MDNRKPENDKQCLDMGCEYHPSGYQRPHIHVMTNNGSYVRFIIEKPKERSDHNADTWG